MSDLHKTISLDIKDYRQLEKYECLTSNAYLACNTRFAGQGAWIWTLEYLSQTHVDIYLYIVQKYNHENIIVTAHHDHILIYERI